MLKAVKAGDHDMVLRILSGHGPRTDSFSNSTVDETSVETRDDFGDTPLVWAVMQGDDEMLQILMDAGANLRVGTLSDGDTPLHRAVKFHQLPLVNQIIEHTTPKEREEVVNLCNTMGLQPLHYAGLNGSSMSMFGHL